MKTDGGWMSISEAARLYGKSRKWVDNQIQQFGITTKKEGNKKLIILADLIAHRGEPPKSADQSTATHDENSQNVTPTSDPDALVTQQIEFLQQRIAVLEADQKERKERETDWKHERKQLQSIIERQTLALPQPPEPQTTEHHATGEQTKAHNGIVARFSQWVQDRL